MPRQLSLTALVGAALVALSATTTSLAAATPAGAPGPLLVFAAASLSDVLTDVDREFTARSGIVVRESFAASSVLAKQIEAGAPADLFLSADREWADYLQQRGLLKSGTQRDLLGNALVLVAPAASRVQLKIAPGFALAAALGAGRLALADPDSVPAGLYARAALTRLGVWDSVSTRLARAENVRTALAYVARSEAQLGIVYRTDALAEKQVRVLDVFPSDTHPPIVYPVALTVSARAEAARLEDFLSSDAARAIFKRYGFVTFAPAPREK